jgi:hypothetical protein
VAISYGDGLACGSPLAFTFDRVEEVFAFVQVVGVGSGEPACAIDTPLLSNVFSNGSPRVTDRACGLGGTVQAAPDQFTWSEDPWTEHVTVIIANSYTLCSGATQSQYTTLDFPEDLVGRFYTLHQSVWTSDGSFSYQLDGTLA